MGEEFYDIVVPGTGTAGLQTAIHAARKRVLMLVLGRIHKRSAYSDLIENYRCISWVDGETMLKEGQGQVQASDPYRGHFAEKAKLTGKEEIPGTWSEPLY